MKLHLDSRCVITVSKTSWSDLRKLFRVMYKFSERVMNKDDKKKKYTIAEHEFDYIAFGMNDRDFKDKACGVFVDKMQYVDVRDILVPFNKRYLAFPIFTGLKDKRYYSTTGFCVCTDKWVHKDFKCFANCSFVDIYLDTVYQARNFQKKLFEAGLIDHVIKSEFSW